MSEGQRKNSLLTAVIKPKFVIALIVLTFAASLLGVLIPQVADKGPSYFEEWKLRSPKTFYLINILQLNRVYTSAWFLALVSVILLSLGYSLYLQIKRNLKARSTEFAPGSKETLNGEQIAVNSVLNADDILKFMKRRGYALKNKKDGSFAFSKNSVNKWGGVIFHSGLFLIIVAALIGLSFQKRGFVQLMEGEIFSGTNEDFLVRDLGVFQKKFDVGFKTQLSKFNHEYWDNDQIKNISSNVLLIGNGRSVRERAITVNKSFRHKGINIYQSFDYGYALTFALIRRDGSQTVTHFLLDRTDKKTKPFAGKSDFPHTNYIFKMKFYPDLSMNSFHLGKPILNLQILKGVRNIVFEGLIIPGDTINVEGNLVRFYGISHWSGLIYVKGVDMTVAYIGFFIVCIGAAIMFLLPHKEIFILYNGGMLSLYGRTNRYKPLFEEELKSIKEGLWNIRR